MPMRRAGSRCRTGPCCAARIRTDGRSFADAKWIYPLLRTAAGHLRTPARNRANKVRETAAEGVSKVEISRRLGMHPRERLIPPTAPIGVAPPNQCHHGSPKQALWVSPPQTTTSATREALSMQLRWRVSINSGWYKGRWKLLEPQAIISNALENRCAQVATNQT